MIMIYANNDINNDKKIMQPLLVERDAGHLTKSIPLEIYIN